MSRFNRASQPGDTIALALIVCERVVIDQTTGQQFILGTLTGITAGQLPVTVNQLAIYAVIEQGTDNLTDFFLGIFDPAGEATVKVALQVQEWGNGIAEVHLPMDGV